MKSRFSRELILVIYDISDDGLRLKVADFLRSKGLTRVQKSAFVGPATSALRIEVEAGLKRLVRGKKGVNIQIYPIPPSSYSRRVVIGELKEYDFGAVEVF